MSSNSILNIKKDGEWVEIPCLKGEDGFSPTATVEKVGKVATITITDINGTTTATIADGTSSGGSGEENTIESISVNGTLISPDVNKNVDITVPDAYDDTDIRTELANKADATAIPSKVSELTNDSNYQTAEQVNSTVTTEIAKVVADAPESLNTLKEMSDWIAGHEDDASAMNSAISDNKTAITALQTGKADKNEIPTTVDELTDSADYAKKTDLHSHENKTVLDGITEEKVTAWDNKSDFSGNYNDLSDKPTIPKGDGTTIMIDESGTLSINLDGTTITLDEAKNVIKLADTLKDKIGSALQPESIVNNQITTETGYALDARQANPNIDGSLAKQISDLNGSLNNLVPVIDDCDLVTTHLAISNNALNNPNLSGVVGGSYALILTVCTPTPQPFNQQIAFVAGSDEIALRGCGGDGKWGAWKKINVN